MTMTSGELYLTRDTRIWAKEFCRVAKDIGFDPTNAEHEDWVRTWMDNAMMRGHDGATGFQDIAHAIIADGREVPKI